MLALCLFYMFLYYIALNIKSEAKLLKRYSHGIFIPTPYVRISNSTEVNCSFHPFEGDKKKITKTGQLENRTRCQVASFSQCPFVTLLAPSLG